MTSRCHRGIPILTFCAAVGVTAIALTPTPKATAADWTDPEPRTVPMVTVAADPDPRPVPVIDVVCDDPLVRLLHDTGWRGQQLRIAYAVVWRESNGRPDAIGDGGYGLFQLQASAHHTKPWWDYELLMDDTYNAAAAYQLWQSNGWRPWGLTRDGQLDARDYTSWSDWQIEHWIMAPFHKYLAQYDNICERKPQ